MYVMYNCILFYFMGVVVECEIVLKFLFYEDFKLYYIYFIWKGVLVCVFCNWSMCVVCLLWSYCVFNLYVDIKNKSNVMGK